MWKSLRLQANAAHKMKLSSIILLTSLAVAMVSAAPAINELKLLQALKQRSDILKMAKESGWTMDLASNRESTAELQSQGNEGDKVDYRESFAELQHGNKVGYAKFQWQGGKEGYKDNRERLTMMLLAKLQQLRQGSKVAHVEQQDNHTSKRDHKISKPHNNVTDLPENREEGNGSDGEHGGGASEKKEQLEEIMSCIHERLETMFENQDKLEALWDIIQCIKHVINTSPNVDNITNYRYIARLH